MGKKLKFNNNVENAVKDILKVIKRESPDGVTLRYLYETEQWEHEQTLISAAVEYIEETGLADIDGKGKYRINGDGKSYIRFLEQHI